MLPTVPIEVECAVEEELEGLLGDEVVMVRDPEQGADNQLASPSMSQTFESQDARRLGFMGEGESRCFARGAVQWLGIAATIVLVLFVVPELLLYLGVKMDIDDTVVALREAGWVGFFAFVAMFTAGQLMRVPGFIFMMIAVITYGKFYGWLANLAALPLVLGAQFTVYRKIGGQALSKVRSPFMKKILVRLDERPMQVVIIIRLCFMMSPLVNMLLAMTSIDGRTYIAGSCIGLLPLMTALSIYTETIYNLTKMYAPLLEGGGRHFHY
mmetsp:Transcript_702/g.1458  ORF Transcript_702/g.1458 Transcript_702/m.1458 type:complete len:269 (-) Transcript_702:199-1005(-)|eukprot:CAMPEP_0114242380 /NCGR_PEP_ID=MMETSP0058-20121206/10135_1 /TAXON_ID=36894 /ORGANISM="Pyramimonas parkeae, CCMP726" /LENGTH=268 /DNA_ID=CAMNT_0001354969 /DNA_START=88 /DNA_END=894 /DNA_ORIENTATION=+